MQKEIAKAQHEVKDAGEQQKAENKADHNLYKDAYQSTGEKHKADSKIHDFSVDKKHSNLPELDIVDGPVHAKHVNKDGSVDVSVKGNAKAEDDYTSHSKDGTTTTKYGDGSTTKVTVHKDGKWESEGQGSKPQQNFNGSSEHPIFKAVEDKKDGKLWFVPDGKDK